jgi:hypothetical protein
LNQGRLRGKIRLVYIPEGDNKLDPSAIFQQWGRKGIISYLNTAKKINTDIYNF